MADEEGRAGRSAAWGVAAVVFGGGAIYVSQLATATASTFPNWPTYLLGVIAAFTLYMVFATIWGWWPTARSIHGTSAAIAELPAADHDPEPTTIAPDSPIVLESSAPSAPVSLLTPPVTVRLKPELDAATNRLRLGALNRGALGRFRVEVIDVHNRNGDWVGPRSWPVPWLDDGSVTAKEIPMFGKPLLDFAFFDFLALKEDLEGTKWLRGDHWVFSSLPEPVKFRYSAVRAWSDLSQQYIAVTLRVIRNEPEGHVDVQFKIGTDGTQPYCRELPERPATGGSLPTDPRQPRVRAATELDAEAARAAPPGERQAVLDTPPRTVPSSMLDQRIYSFDDPDGKALHERLAELYEPQRARSLSMEAGLRVERIDFRGSAFQVWENVLESAARSAHLRDLARVIINDPESVLIRPLLDRLLAA